MKKSNISKTPVSQSALSQRALLVSVSLSQWTARRLSQEATETVSSAYNTDSSAGGYTKKLLPGATELQSVNVVGTQIRKYFYEQTLPWMSDGSRIISAKNHLKFATEFRKMKNEFETAVASFVSAYPSLQAKAQVTLGKLYNSAEYPDASEIGDKFKCEVNYLPLPDVKDFRVEVSEAEKRAFVEKMKQVETAASRDAWDRLHSVVKNAAEKLMKPDAIFRDSLLENVQDICNLLPSLNISEDPKLETARRDVEKLLNGIGSADTIRNDTTKRKDAAKALKNITDSMGAYMGAGK